MTNSLSQPINPFAPLCQLAEAIGSESLSPLVLTEQYLQRIEQFDERLHAYVNVYTDDARRAAEAAGKMIGAGHRLGPLHGIPLALKDIVEWRGRITTAGSPAWRQRQSTQTASIVHRLLAAGAIVLGKTHTVELAFGGWGTNEHMGAPRNPWDEHLHRTPGGSSSGSAVATAAGLCAASIGTDTGGSVRVPAGFCGAVGLKTTLGLIPTDGIVPLAESLDTVGPITRTVEDAAWLFNALRGAPVQGDGGALDPMPTLRLGIRRLRLARISGDELACVEPEVLAHFDNACRQLESLGASLFDLPLPRKIADYRESNAVIMAAEGYAEHAELIESLQRPMDRHVRARYAAGASISSRDYLLARRDRHFAQQEIAAAMDGVDALLTPTSPMSAVDITTADESTTPGHFARFSNFLNWCGLSVPCGFTGTALPVGLLINAPGYSEPTVLRIGWAYENAFGSSGKGPGWLS